MATKIIKAWIDGAIQEIEVEDIAYPEQPLSVDERVDKLEDKHEVTYTDGNFLVGNGTEELEEMTPSEVLEHIDGASIMTMTTAEYEAMSDDESNANTLYMLTDNDDRPDWNVSDETADNYIKNRPFYEEDGVVHTIDPKYIKDMYYETEPVETVLVPETTIDFIDNNPAENPFTIKFTEGKTYKVVWDGTAYECVSYVFAGVYSPSIGNNTILVGDAGDGGSNEPFFCFSSNDGYVALFAEETGEHTISISLIEQELHQIDPKYIKDMYYEETVAVPTTIEFTNELVDAEFAQSLYKNRQTASYTINGVSYAYRNDEFPPFGVVWNVANENGEAIIVQVVPDAPSGTVNNRIIIAGDVVVTVDVETKVVHQIDEKYIPDSIARVENIPQPDWNQSDETASDYIKNRTHWISNESVEILPETEYACTYQGAKYGVNGIDITLINGNKYIVIFNDDTYELTAFESEAPITGDPVICIGNVKYGYNIVSSEFIDTVDTGEPFLIADGKLRVEHGTESVTLAIYEYQDVVHQLDEKYIPSSIARTSDVTSALTEAKSYADTAASTAADTVKNDLLNGAGEAYDTLKELGDLITENTTALDALETVATNKADKEHTHSWDELEDKPFGEEQKKENLVWTSEAVQDLEQTTYDNGVTGITINNIPIAYDELVYANSTDITNLGDFTFTFQGMMNFFCNGDDNKGFMQFDIDDDGSAGSYYCYGNLSLIPTAIGEPDTGEQYALIVSYPNTKYSRCYLQYFTNDSNYLMGNFKLIKYETTYTQLDEQHIPDTIARVEDVDTALETVASSKKDKDFVVTITETTTDGTTTRTVDKTFAEIETAINEGRTIICNTTYGIMQLVRHSAGSAVAFKGGNTYNNYMYMIMSSGNIIFSSASLNDYQHTSQKSTTLSADSTDYQYPSAKAVVDYVDNSIAAIPAQVQSDWTETDETAMSYIKNKPEIATSDDAVELLAEYGIIDPLSSSDGTLYTNSEGKIYTF